MEFRFRHPVLGKYDATYVWCKACGLLQAESPFWLEEAYALPIATMDTGILQRNLSFATLLGGLLWFSTNGRGTFVDVAGGYGLLVRLMRDRGFDFRWHDRYAKNLVARGFEAEPGGAHEAITAMEVLEHVTDPLQFLRDNLERWRSRTIVFTTTLYGPGEPPEPDAWWYYAFGAGQHVSFFARRTLAAIAERLGLSLHSRGDVHVLTEREIGPLTFRALTDRRISRVAEAYVRMRMPSRTRQDFQDLQGGGARGPARSFATRSGSRNPCSSG